MTTPSDWTPLQGDPGADETIAEWAADMVVMLARMSERTARGVWHEMTDAEQDAVTDALRADWIDGHTSLVDAA